MKTLKQEIDSRFLEAVEILKGQGETAKSISLAMEENDQYVSKISKGKHSVSLDAINLLVKKFPNISREYLMDGVGGLFKKEFKNADRIVVKDSNFRLPFFNIDVAASNIGMYDDLREEAEFYLDLPEYRDCDLGVRVYGNSMYPEIESGDWVILKKRKDKLNVPLGQVFVIVTEEDKLVKQVRKGESEGTYMLHSWNTSHDPFPVEIDKIKEMYLVKGIIKRKLI